MVPDKLRQLQLFKIPDKDGNGEISWSEFVSFQLKSKKVMKSDWALDIQTIRDEFTEMDSDSNGRISKKEFLRAFENLHKRLVRVTYKLMYDSVPRSPPSAMPPGSPL